MSPVLATTTPVGSMISSSPALSRAAYPKGQTTGVKVSPNSMAVPVSWSITKRPSIRAAGHPVSNIPSLLVVSPPFVGVDVQANTTIAIKPKA